MATYFRPKTTTLGGTAVTTVTSVTINHNRTSGQFAGDNDNLAAGWLGVGTITGSITLADPAQALALIGKQGSLVLVMAGVAGAADYTVTVLSLQVQSEGISQGFDANSAVTLPLVYVGASTGTVAGAITGA